MWSGGTRQAREAEELGKHVKPRNSATMWGATAQARGDRCRHRNGVGEHIMTVKPSQLYANARASGLEGITVGEVEPHTNVEGGTWTRRLIRSGTPPWCANESCTRSCRPTWPPTQRGRTVRYVRPQTQRITVRTSPFVLVLWHAEAG